MSARTSTSRATSLGPQNCQSPRQPTESASRQPKASAASDHGATPPDDPIQGCVTPRARADWTPAARGPFEASTAGSAGSSGQASFPANANASAAPELLTSAQLAKRLQYRSSSAVHMAVSRGHLPRPMLRGRTWLFAWNEVASMLTRRASVGVVEGEHHDAPTHGHPFARNQESVRSHRAFVPALRTLNERKVSCSAQRTSRN
ncbi:MAG: hypothetical protein RL701_2958 [Pseudomonadota bacterium]